MDGHALEGCFLEDREPGDDGVEDRESGFDQHHSGILAVTARFGGNDGEENGELVAAELLEQGDGLHQGIEAEGIGGGGDDQPIAAFNEVCQFIATGAGLGVDDDVTMVGGVFGGLKFADDFAGQLAPVGPAGGGAVGVTVDE